jgi:hypothetical protein
VASKTRLGLEKIRTDLSHFRTTFFFHRGGGVLARPMENVNLVSTCYIINAASLLDEGLDRYIAAHHPRAKPRPDTLGKRIDYLKAKGVLQSASRLHRIRKARNRYAHEPGQYGDLPELDQTLDTIEAELTQLGIL